MNSFSKPLPGSSARAANSRPAMRQFIGPDVFLEIHFGIDWAARFQHDDVEATFGENLGGGSSGRARPTMHTS